MYPLFVLLYYLLLYQSPLFLTLLHILTATYVGARLSTYLTTRLYPAMHSTRLLAQARRRHSVRMDSLLRECASLAANGRAFAASPYGGSAGRRHGLERASLAANGRAFAASPYGG